MGHRAVLDECGKSRPPTGIRPPDLPARSELLHQVGCYEISKGILHFNLRVPQKDQRNMTAYEYHIHCHLVTVNFTSHYAQGLYFSNELCRQATRPCLRR